MTSVTPFSRCRASLASRSALWFHSRFICKKAWSGHDRNFSIALCRNNCNPGALQSTSPRICRITKLESPQMITRPLVWLASKSKLRSNPRYSASFTVRSVANSDAAATTVHSGNFQMIALYAPPFRFTLADPSKLATRRLSPISTVGGGMLIVCLGCFRGAMAINTSSTSARGVTLAANTPSISSSPFSHRRISKDQFESSAAHRPNLPLRPEDCNSHASVECRVKTVISRETSIV